MIDMHILGPVMTGVASGVVATFFLTRRNRSLDCRDLVRRLHPHQLKGITDLLDESINAHIFWDRSHGVKGLWKRWNNATILLQLAQVSGSMGFATPEEVEYVLERALKMSAASRSAFLWGMLRWLAPEKSAYKLQLCLKLYAEIAFRTHSLYADDGTHLCASMLASLL